MKPLQANLPRLSGFPSVRDSATLSILKAKALQYLSFSNALLDGYTVLTGIKIYFDYLDLRMRKILRLRIKLCENNLNTTTYHI